MSGLPRFYKLSGGGNDFLALPEPDREPEADEIRAWCRRGVSLGADGLFVLRRSAGELAMDYWNADGIRADLCLNGTRCAAQLGFELGWAGSSVAIATSAGRIGARRLDATRVALELPPPGEPRELAVGVEGQAVLGWAVEVGVPHFVLLAPVLESAPVVRLGRRLRSDPAFGAAGANVDFVRFRAPDRMEIRTYERGVEDETLACGTGVVAGAAVGLRLGLARSPLTALTRGGFELEVGKGEADSWLLAGDARLVAAGELFPAAGVAPTAPPAWT